MYPGAWKAYVRDDSIGHGHDDTPRHPICRHDFRLVFTKNPWFRVLLLCQLPSLSLGESDEFLQLEGCWGYFFDM